MRFHQLLGRERHFAGVLCQLRAIEVAENRPMLRRCKARGFPKAREGGELVSVEFVDCGDEAGSAELLEL